MSRKNRKKKKRMLGLPFKNSEVTEEQKVLIGFYQGNHNIKYNKDFEKYIELKDLKRLAIVASPPLFRTGLVYNLETKKADYVAKLEGRQTLKLDVYEIDESEFDDLLNYTEINNLEIVEIETIIGKVNIFIYLEDITFYCECHDEYALTYNIKKFENKK